jgi:hypothetical protein
LATSYVKSAKPAIAAVEASKKAFKNLFIQDDYQAKVAQFFGEKLHPRLLYFPDYKVIDGIIDIALTSEARRRRRKRATLATSSRRQKPYEISSIWHSWNQRNWKRWQNLRRVSRRF